MNSPLASPVKANSDDLSVISDGVENINLEEEKIATNRNNKKEKAKREIKDYL